MTAFLRTVKFYQQMSQSNSFNGNDLIVLFDWGWLRLMNKLKEAWICLHQRLEYQNDQSPFNSHTLADGRVYPYSVLMREYADQNHSEYDTFYAVQKLGFSIFHGELIKVNYNEKSADIICYVLASLVFW